MKREGNEILFDTPTQKSEFERTMSSASPQFIRELMGIISTLQVERDRVWRKLIEELKANGDLIGNESLSYNWMQRKLIVEEVANNESKAGNEG